MERPLVFVDTETANLRGAPHLLELGAVRVVDGEVQETFDELVLPSVEIDPEATAIHGIDDGMIRRADPAPEVLERFHEWVGDDWMVAHNAPFDARVLAFECARAGLEPPPGPFLDTLILARKFVPESPDHKLATLTQFLDLEDGEHHRALADAVWCWQVFEACVERAGGPAAVELGAWLGRVPVTVKGRWPGPPRMSSRLRGIERAIASGDEVTLDYVITEGSSSGLRCRPRFLFERRGKGYVEAECSRSGVLKTYLLERVRKVR